MEGVIKSSHTEMENLKDSLKLCGFAFVALFGTVVFIVQQIVETVRAQKNGKHWVVKLKVFSFQPSSIVSQNCSITK